MRVVSAQRRGLIDLLARATVRTILNLFCACNMEALADAVVRSSSRRDSTSQPRMPWQHVTASHGTSKCPFYTLGEQCDILGHEAKSR